MDTYKLTYFNLRGIAEPIRLIFKHKNVPYQENEIDSKTWPDVKTDFEWQQLPILEFNGKTLTQTIAIGRFLAQKFHLLTEDPWEDAKCNEIVGAVTDLRLHLKPFVLAKMVKSDDVKEQKEKLLGSIVPLYLENINGILQDIRSGNPCNGNFILGEKLSWSDFWLAHFSDQWTSVLEDSLLLDRYPLLKNQQSAVYNLPGVAEWVASRPNTFI